MYGGHASGNHGFEIMKDEKAVPHRPLEIPENIHLSVGHRGPQDMCLPVLTAAPGQVS